MTKIQLHEAAQTVEDRLRVTLTCISEMRGTYPDIALPGDIDRAALGEDAFFVTLPIGQAGAKSRNQRRYSRAAVEQMVAQINQQRPEGMWGHVAADEAQTRYDPPAIRWLAARMDGDGIAWGKGLPLTAETREYYRLAKATNARVGTSLVAWAQMDGSEVTALELVAVDLADPARVGVPVTAAQAVISKEMEGDAPDLPRQRRQGRKIQRKGAKAKRKAQRRADSTCLPLQDDALAALTEMLGRRGRRDGAGQGGDGGARGAARCRDHGDGRAGGARPGGGGAGRGTGAGAACAAAEAPAARRSRRRWRRWSRASRCGRCCATVWRRRWVRRSGVRFGARAEERVFQLLAVASAVSYDRETDKEIQRKGEGETKFAKERRKGGRHTGLPLRIPRRGINMAGQNTYLESDGRSVAVTLSASVDKNQVAYVEGWLGIANQDGVSGDVITLSVDRARVPVHRAVEPVGEQGGDGLRRRDRPDGAHPGRHGVLHGGGHEPGRAVQGDGGEGRQRRRDGGSDRRIDLSRQDAKKFNAKAQR